MNLPPLPTTSDVFEMLERPDNAERAATATVTRLAVAAGLDLEDNPR